MSMDGKEDYSDLPPNQKKKKLQAKVMELSKQVSTLIYIFLNSNYSVHLFILL